jgi:hypothetical protein
MERARRTPVKPGSYGTPFGCISHGMAILTYLCLVCISRASVFVGDESAPDISPGALLKSAISLDSLINRMMDASPPAGELVMAFHGLERESQACYSNRLD